MKRIILWIFAISWALLIWRLTTTPDFKVTEDTFFSLIISSAGHFIFFGVQAALLRLSLSIPLSISVASFYGLVIELVQRTVPGRSADPFDWILDTLGALAFVAIINKYYLNPKG